MKELFQSTLPTRGETCGEYFCLCAVCISIHSPHTGRDSASQTGRPLPGYFNPLSPHGERPGHFPLASLAH